MDIAFFVLMLLFIFLLISHAPVPGQSLTKSKCPPHDWFSKELKDDKGEIQGYKLMCKKCGPHKGDA